MAADTLGVFELLKNTGLVQSSHDFGFDYETCLII
jgi:hypothetical protein